VLFKQFTPLTFGLTQTRIYRLTLPGTEPDVHSLLNTDYKHTHRCTMQAKLFGGECITHQLTDTHNSTSCLKRTQVYTYAVTDSLMEIGVLSLRLNSGWVQLKWVF